MKLVIPSRRVFFTSCRYLSHAKRKLVLGIETSCDDTGAAVVDDNAEVVGEALHSQTATTVELGGILPRITRDLHRKHIESVVTAAMQNAAVSFQDLDAIAVTVKPGMSLSLMIGLTYAKQLVERWTKPLIPVHHLEAHALTIRMLEKVEFPFVVLLASGGNCLLAVARDIDDFLLIGSGMRTATEAPGEAYDKIARELKLKNLPQCAGLSGGAAVELIARDGDPFRYETPHIVSDYRNCDFSFSGLKSHMRTFIQDESERQGIVGGDILPNVADICASFQFGVLRHICQRVVRGLIFCESRNLVGEQKTLVVSGGVASNQFLRRGLEAVCAEHDCHVICPPPRLCTDNGVMVAWNGMQKLLAGRGFAEDPMSVRAEAKCPFGEDISDQVELAHIKSSTFKWKTILAEMKTEQEKQQL